MGFRFRKSVKIVPGVKLNIGKNGVGMSVGNKYSGVSVNTSGRKSSRVSLPGTGVSYVSTSSGKKKQTRNKQEAKKKQTTSQEQTEFNCEPIDLNQEYIAPLWYKKWFRVFFRILSILITVLGILCLAAVLPLGIIFTAIGVSFVCFSFKIEKKETLKWNCTSKKHG